jgi:hypothetical protein
MLDRVPRHASLMCSEARIVGVAFWDFFKSPSQNRNNLHANGVSVRSAHQRR